MQTLFTASAQLTDPQVAESEKILPHLRAFAGSAPPPARPYVLLGDEPRFAAAGRIYLIKDMLGERGGRRPPRWVTPYRPLPCRVLPA